MNNDTLGPQSVSFTEMIFLKLLGVSFIGSFTVIIYPSATTNDPVTAENVAYETTVIPTACNPAYESVARQDLAVSSATAAT